MLIASASYCFVALVDMSFRALQPIFLSTPVELGGLGLDPPMIGTIMSFFGILNGVLTVFFFSRMTDYFGVKGVYLIGMTAAVSCFSLFPLISHLARNSIQRSGDLGTVVWITVGIQVVLSVLVCLCYGTSTPKWSKFAQLILKPTVPFRRGIYFHRRSRTEQGFFGDHERAGTSVGVCRACGWPRPREFGVFFIDR